MYFKNIKIINQKEKTGQRSEDVAGSSRSAQSLFLLDGGFLGLGRNHRRQNAPGVVPVLLGDELALPHKREDSLQLLHVRSGDADLLPLLALEVVHHPRVHPALGLHHQGSTVVTVDALDAKSPINYFLERHLLELPFGFGRVFKATNVKKTR